MFIVGILHPSFNDEPKWSREPFDIKLYFRDFIDKPIWLNYGRQIGTIHDAWINERGQLCIIGKIDGILSVDWTDLAINYMYDVRNDEITNINARGCDIVPEGIYKTTKFLRF